MTSLDHINITVNTTHAQAEDKKKTHLDAHISPSKCQLAKFYPPKVQSIFKTNSRWPSKFEFDDILDLLNL